MSAPPMCRTARPVVVPAVLLGTTAEARPETATHTATETATSSVAKTAAQRSDALGGLAFDSPGRAAEQLSGLVHVQVAVEAKDERGPLPGRERRQGGPHIQHGVGVGQVARRLGQRRV